MYDVGRTLAAAAQSGAGGVRALARLDALRGAGTELAWVTAHLALYPWGVRQERGRRGDRRRSWARLPPVQRALMISDVAAAGTPILLVHGMVDNRSVFTLLRRALRRRGFGRVLSLNYSPFTADVRTAAGQLAELVERTCAETGYERVHVVGHSLGGIIARYYVQRMGGDHRVHTLCTLGTPHAGTHAARLLPAVLPLGTVRQLRPGSDLLRELAEPAPGCRTRFVAFWSDLDQMVLPRRSAAIEHPDLSARNIELAGVGHMSLPIHRGVVQEIARLLAHLEEDGSTRTPGVIPLASAPPARVVPRPRAAHRGDQVSYPH